MGGAGTGTGTGSRSVNPRCAGSGAGAGGVAEASGLSGGKPGGEGGTAGNGGKDVTGGNGGKGDSGGCSVMLTGAPPPGRRPRVPKCSDSTRACSRSDASTPARRRRPDGSVVMAGAAAETWCMLRALIDGRKEILR